MTVRPLDHSYVKKRRQKGYILKDSDPSELQAAIGGFGKQKGFYYSELVSGKLINAINKMDDEGEANIIKLNEEETTF